MSHRRRERDPCPVFVRLDEWWGQGELSGHGICEVRVQGLVGIGWGIIYPEGRAERKKEKGWTSSGRA